MAKVGFGRNNPFPLRLGGGVSHVATAADEIKDALSPGFATKEDSVAAAYAYAEGRMIGAIWNFNERLKNQGLARKCIEWLPVWEEVLQIRPTVRQTENDRRAAVAARLKIVGNFSMDRLEDTCEAMLGQVFVGISRVDDADVIRYYSPVNPGPAGFEWFSNKLAFQVEVQKNGMDDGLFLDLMTQFSETLQRSVPTWCDFWWHTGQGFVVGDSILGEAAYD